jgi:hypothetical protein
MYGWSVCVASHFGATSPGKNSGSCFQIRKLRLIARGFCDSGYSQPRRRDEEEAKAIRESSTAEDIDGQWDAAVERAMNGIRDAQSMDVAAREMDLAASSSSRASTTIGPLRSPAVLAP